MDATVNTIANAAWANIDLLNAEFDAMETAHPEIWSNKVVCSAFDYFYEKYKSAQFNSLAGAMSGISEIREALEVLVRTTRLALEAK